MFFFKFFLPFRLLQITEKSSALQVLVGSLQDLNSWPRTEPQPLTVRAPSRNHWTTRNSLGCLFLIVKIHAHNENRQWKCCHCPISTTTTTTLIKIQIGNFLAVHCLDPKLSLPRTQVQSPVKKLRSHKLQAMQPKKKLAATQIKTSSISVTLWLPQAPNSLYPP